MKNAKHNKRKVKKSTSHDEHRKVQSSSMTDEAESPKTWVKETFLNTFLTFLPKNALVAS